MEVYSLHQFFVRKRYSAFVLVLWPETTVSLLQSTLVISKSKGPSKTVRDIRTSTYHMCRNEENTNRTTKFYK